MNLTNYFETFIEVAKDIKVDFGTIAPTKEKKSVV